MFDGMLIGRSSCGRYVGYYSCKKLQDLLDFDGSDAFSMDLMVVVVEWMIVRL